MKENEKVGLMRATLEVIGEDAKKFRKWSAFEKPDCGGYLFFKSDDAFDAHSDNLDRGGLVSLLSAVICGISAHITTQLGMTNLETTEKILFGLLGSFAPMAIYNGCNLSVFVGKKIYEAVGEKIKQIEKRANMPLKKLSTSNVEKKPKEKGTE